MARSNLLVPPLRYHPWLRELAAKDAHHSSLPLRCVGARWPCPLAPSFGSQARQLAPPTCEGVVEQVVDILRLYCRPPRNRTPEHRNTGASNEGKRHPARDVAALAAAADAARDGRHRSWDLEGRVLKHSAARPDGLAVRDARARPTPIRAHHHAARRVNGGSHARPSHERGTLPRDREVRRRLLLRLDTLGARRDR